MNFIELSIENVRKNSIDLAKIIESDYKPDCIVFIAKGSHLIGKSLSEYFGVPIVEVFATREGNKLKERLKFILKIIPKNLKLFLRKIELNSNVHNVKSDRAIEVKKGIDILNRSKQILVVDDSVDTGHSAKSVIEYIKLNSDSQVKFATFNVFTKSKELINIEYTLYEDSIIIGPWSKDSGSYDEYMKLYYEDKKSNAY